MSRPEKLVVDPCKDSKTQAIQRLRASMPNPRCTPVPTVCDLRWNVMSSKTYKAMQVKSEQMRALGPRKRLWLDVSPPRWVTRNAPCPNTGYLSKHAYFPKDLFSGAVKGYLINVYGRTLTYPNVGATLTPRSSSVTSDSSWIIIGDSKAWACLCHCVWCSCWDWDVWTRWPCNGLQPDQLVASCATFWGFIIFQNCLSHFLQSWGFCIVACRAQLG